METKHDFNQDYEDPSINHISEPRMNESLMTIGSMNDYAVKAPMTVLTQDILTVTVIQQRTLYVTMT
jgi:hypothetical protein